MENTKNCYVYILFRETDLPFYVGKGSGDRWNDHERHEHKRGKTHKDKIVRYMLRNNLPIRKVKFAVGLTHEASLFLEKVLIEKIGRHPIGPLANGTDGGEGHSNPSLEARAKLSAAHKGHKYHLGRKNTPETIARMSAAKMGNCPSPEAREKIRQKLTGRHPTEETRKKLADAKIGTKFTEEHRANMSKAKMKENLKPETLEKRSKALTGQKRTPEAKAKMRESRLRYLASQRGGEG
jgi:hypothetical protein